MHYTVLFMLLIHYYTVSCGHVNVAILLPVAFSTFLMSCMKNLHFLKVWTVFQDSANRKISNSKQWMMFAIFYLRIINYFYCTLAPKRIHELSKERKGLKLKWCIRNCYIWGGKSKLSIHDNQSICTYLATRNLCHIIFIHVSYFFFFRVKFTFYLD